MLLHVLPRRPAVKWVASMLGGGLLDVEIGQCLPVPEAQAPTGEMAVTPPSIRKSAPTTYAESSDAR